MTYRMMLDTFVNGLLPELQHWVIADRPCSYNSCVENAFKVHFAF